MGLHCAYGLCKSDGRYQHKEHMKGVSFIRIPLPCINLEMCKRWVHACGRADFTYKNVTRHTYICTKHFVGGEGPTKEHPHPIPFCPVNKSGPSRPLLRKRILVPTNKTIADVSTT